MQAFPIRKTDKIKQAKYRKYLNCMHLSSKQIHLYVCVKYLSGYFFIMSFILRYLIFHVLFCLGFFVKFVLFKVVTITFP